MPSVDPRTYVPGTDPSALRKLVELSRKPADTEDPARDGKGDHAFGCPRRGDIHGALLAEARLLVAKIGHMLEADEARDGARRYASPCVPWVASRIACIEVT